MSASTFEVDGRRVSYDYTGRTQNRRPSLKEMPSFRNEASKALDRRDDLARLKERLSFNRDLLNGDPASKPWLRKSSVPIRESPPRVASVQQHKQGTPPPDARTLYHQLYEDDHHHHHHLHTATPATVVDATASSSASVMNRSRNLSRGTSASGESSEGSFMDNSYDY